MRTALSVLVVEDDEDIRDRLVARLTRLDYRVDAAPTGEAGFEAALADPPDLVLVDALLAGADGLAVTRRLRAQPRTARVPVLVVSMADQGPDERFRPRDVEAMVQALLGPALTRTAALPTTGRSPASPR